MQQFLFLRAVNVGKRKLPSADLVELLEAMKLGKPGVFLASGNAAFQSRKSAAKLESELEKQVEKKFGYFAECFVRSREQLETLAVANPFQLTHQQEQEWLVNLVFFKEPSPTAALAKQLKSLTSSYDDFAIHQGHLYWLCRGQKMTDSPIAETLPKHLPTPNTTRKRDTIIRLLKRFPK